MSRFTEGLTRVLSREKTIKATRDPMRKSAGLKAVAGQMKDVRQVIEGALSGAGLTRPRAAAGARDATTGKGLQGRSAVDGHSHITHIGASPASKKPMSGEFLSLTFSNDAGTRTYKLYIPASYMQHVDERVPLVVMLHGCTQSPDDFAAGTRMNALADQHGFLVAYPAQSSSANGSKCWNWFREEDQSRGRGEPSILAGITREIMTRYRVDPHRIFVAGLSAGAAMAVILGATYPELFSAVGAHSGLPYRAAHDVSSALHVMKSGPASAGQHVAHHGHAAHAPKPRRSPPTIVFHGDSDHTVSARNAPAIVEQATNTAAGETRLHAKVVEGVAPDRRGFSRTVYADNAHHPVAEQWILHGAGHAWSGGSSRGTHTDEHGPDASAEMIRFFSSLSRKAAVPARGAVGRVANGEAGAVSNFRASQAR